MSLIRTIATASIAGLAFGVVACQEEAAPTTGDSTSSAAPTTANWQLASMPADAQGVKAIKDTAAEGDTVTVRGIIGGRKDALSTDSAFFVMVDPGLENICTSEDDHCATPWDYCCAMPEDVQANSATVQLVDADGNPLEFDLSAQGVSPLDEVVVVGTVAARPTPQVLTIRATGLHRVGQ
ncbi:MAG: hypothetical protein NCW75_12700 [Phycisphaera sp.]|nr:MAG: hypothetical protein NCW75_12700 [Phycisphaera sp.]